MKPEVVEAIKVHIRAIVSQAEYVDGEYDNSSCPIDEIFSILNTGVFPKYLDVTTLYLLVRDEFTCISKNSQYLLPSEAKDMETRLANLILYMPHEYVFYFRLPSSLPLEDDLLIDEQISIIRATKKTMARIAKNNTQTYIGRNKLNTLLLKKTGAPVPKPTPDYRNLIEGGLYLKVRTNGVVVQNSAKTIINDPIQIFNLLISLMVVHGVLSDRGLESLLNIRQYDSSYILVYNEKWRYVTNMQRTFDEIEYMNSLVVPKSLNVEKFNESIIIFKKLVNNFNNQYLEQQRNKIVNSLHWYMEGNRSKNISFKLLMSAAMFDAFETARSNRKDTIKAIIEICNFGANMQKAKIDLLTDMYNKRDDVAHGNVQLFELKQQDTPEGFSKLATVALLYQHFMRIKIQTLLEE